MARGKWEPTRGPVLEDGSWWPDRAGDMGTTGGGNRRPRGIRTAEMMEGSGKKLAKRSSKEGEEQQNKNEVSGTG